MNFRLIQGHPRGLSRFGSRYDYSDFANAFKVEFASYNSQSLDVSGKDTDVVDVLLSPDGYYLYLLGNSTDTIYMYALCTALDLSTASYIDSYDFSSETTTATGLQLDSSGAILMISDAGGTVYHYALEIHFDISTATYLSGVNIDLTTETTNCQGIFLANDHTLLFAVDGGGDVYRYPLTHIHETSYVAAGDVSVKATTLKGMAWKPDGTKVFITDGDQYIHEYAVSPAWDVTGFTFTQSFNVVTRQYADLAISPDGTVIFVINNLNDTIYEVDLGTPWSLTGAAEGDSFSLATECSAPVGLFVNDAGTKLYVGCTVANTVLYYSMTSAWDATTLSYQSASPVLGYAPSDIQFSVDGDEVYISNGATVINEYELDTPYDISDLSSPLAITLNTTTAIDAFYIRPDTTAVYNADNVSDDIHQHTWAPAHTIGSATSLDISTQSTDCTAIGMNGSGSKLLVGDTTDDFIYQFNLPQVYSLGSGSYDSVGFDVSNEVTGFEGFCISLDGTTMYCIDNSAPCTIYEYKME